jgi:hypothetical protein
MGLSLSFLLHQQILVDEAGNHSGITGYGAGYWLWVASTATAVIGCLVAVCARPVLKTEAAGTED